MATVEETARRRTAPGVGLVVLATGLALMAALSWRAAGRLPDPVALAGTGRDGADQHAPRVLALTAMPLLSLALAAALLAAQRLRRAAAAAFGLPPWRDDASHRRAVDLGLRVPVPVLLALHLLVLRAAEGQPGSGLRYVAAAVAMLVVVLGNVWPKQVPWVPNVVRTRLDPGIQPGLDRALEAHRRTLHPTGVTVVLLGLVALACAWLAPLVSLGVCLLAVLHPVGVLLATTWRSGGPGAPDSHSSS